MSEMVSVPQTDPDLLERLVAAARNYRMTPEEVRQQRVSWVWGQMSGKLTKEEVSAILARHGQ